MGLSWFELEVGFPTGPKAKALIARLRNPTADAYPMRLWAYCYMNETDRFEGETAAGIIEEACVWRGKRGALVEALMACRFVDRDGDALVVHGVRERLDRALDYRDGARERQRLLRERRRLAAAEAARAQEEEQSSDVLGDIPGDVTSESRAMSRVTSRSTDRPTDRPTDQEASSLASLARSGRAKAKLGPLGAAAVAEVARGLGHALKPAATQADADEFEERLRAAGGVEPAVAFFAASCRERDTEPEGVGLLLLWLRDLDQAPRKRPAGGA